MTRTACLAMLLSFALLTKALIPAGWMPTGRSAFEITVCTGMGIESLWLDHNGNLHKQEPAGSHDEVEDEPCPYAALAAAANLPDMASLALPAHDTSNPVQGWPINATIGHGLAAPPPPSTGPPILI